MTISPERLEALERACNDCERAVDPRVGKGLITPDELRELVRGYRERAELRNDLKRHESALCAVHRLNDDPELMGAIDTALARGIKTP